MTVPSPFFEQVYPREKLAPKTGQRGPERSEGFAMKSWSWLVVIVLALGPVAPIWGEDPSGPVVTASADFNSAYIWRGLTLNDGWIFQPALDIGGLKLGSIPIGVNIWSIFNLDDFGGSVRKNQFSEVDITLSAELGAGFEASYIEYIYTAGAFADSSVSVPGTREIALSWTQEMPFTPTVTLYYDMKEVGGGFLQLSLARAFDLSEKASLSLQADVGVASDAFARYYGGAKGGFYQYQALARLSCQATDRVSIYASAAYTNGFGHDILPQQPTDFYGGVGIAITF